MIINSQNYYNKKIFIISIISLILMSGSVFKIFQINEKVVSLSIIEDGSFICSGRVVQSLLEKNTNISNRYLDNEFIDGTKNCFEELVRETKGLTYGPLVKQSKKLFFSLNDFYDALLSNVDYGSSYALLERNHQELVDSIQETMKKLNGKLDLYTLLSGVFILILFASLFKHKKDMENSNEEVDSFDRESRTLSSKKTSLEKRELFLRNFFDELGKSGLKNMFDMFVIEMKEKGIVEKTIETKEKVENKKELTESPLLIESLSKVLRSFSGRLFSNKITINLETADDSAIFFKESYLLDIFEETLKKIVLLLKGSNNSKKVINIKTNEVGENICLIFKVNLSFYERKKYNETLFSISSKAEEIFEKNFARADVTQKLDSYGDSVNLSIQFSFFRNSAEKMYPTKNEIRVINAQL